MFPATGHLTAAQRTARADPAAIADSTVSLRQALARLGTRPSAYTVKPGDTLSSIAARYYSRPSDWPVLYWANHIRWADVIEAGQVLAIPPEPAAIPAAPGQLEAPAPPVARPVLTPVLVAYAAPVTAAPDQAPVPVQATTVSYQGGSYPGGAFGACVVKAESGGNAQVMNASGHYGLYQFSASTWQEYGGSAADFGDATVAEQDQVFANALAAGGESNWSEYDGCL